MALWGLAYTSIQGKLRERHLRQGVSRTAEALAVEGPQWREGTQDGFRNTTGVARASIGLVLAPVTPDWFIVTLSCCVTAHYYNTKFL